MEDDQKFWKYKNIRKNANLVTVIGLVYSFYATIFLFVIILALSIASGSGFIGCGATSRAPKYDVLTTDAEQLRLEDSTKVIVESLKELNFNNNDSFCFYNRVVHRQYLCSVSAIVPESNSGIGQVLQIASPLVESGELHTASFNISESGMYQNGVLLSRSEFLQIYQNFDMNWVNHFINLFDEISLGNFSRNHAALGDGIEMVTYSGVNFKYAISPENVVNITLGTMTIMGITGKVTLITRLGATKNMEYNVRKMKRKAVTGVVRASIVIVIISVLAIKTTVALISSNQGDNNEQTWFDKDMHNEAILEISSALVNRDFISIAGKYEFETTSLEFTEVISEDELMSQENNTVFKLSFLAPETIEDAPGTVLVHSGGYFVNDIQISKDDLDTIFASYDLHEHQLDINALKYISEADCTYEYQKIRNGLYWLEAKLADGVRYAIQNYDEDKEVANKIGIYANGQEIQIKKL